jgi:hypothetical protein
MFVHSHPFARKKAKGWGTELPYTIREMTYFAAASISASTAAFITPQLEKKRIRLSVSG